MKKRTWHPKPQTSLATHLLVHQMEICDGKLLWHIGRSRIRCSDAMMRHVSTASGGVAGKGTTRHHPIVESVPYLA